jgi:hypothetical protein
MNYAPQMKTGKQAYVYVHGKAYPHLRFDMFVGCRTLLWGF